MRLREYWDQFYAKGHTADQSPFAMWLAGRIHTYNTVLDLGCGNGRDSRFFRNHGHEVIAVDQCAEGEGYITADLLSYLRDRPGPFDVVYMRFVLHAVPPTYAPDLLIGAVNAVAPGGILACEQRSRNGHHPTDHPRWPVDSRSLLTSVMTYGLRVEHFEERTGLAPYGDEDPLVSRLVAGRPS